MTRDEPLPRGRRRPDRGARRGSWLGAVRVAVIGLCILAVHGPASAQTTTPFHQTNVPLASTASELVYTVDLGSLPARPAMIVEIAPDAAHPNIQLELRILGCTVFDAGGFCPAVLPQQPDTAKGAKRLVYEPFLCEVRSEYVGETCEVRVRAVDFGSGGAPATVDVTIRGETRPPTGTEEIVIDPSLQSISIPASKDTTLYQASTSSGNGAGESFWSTFSTGSTARHGLVDFDVTTYVPAGVEVVDASLQLGVLSSTAGASFTVYAVPGSGGWTEGTQNAAGDESTAPAAGVGPQASWLYRSWNTLFLPLGPWTTPGGDRGASPLLTSSVSGTGAQGFSSSALIDHVGQVRAGSVAEDGFLVVPAAGSIRFASRENATSFRPSLYVQYTAPATQEQLDTGTMNYFNEGQNFRWIYDLENDNVLYTPNAGRCEVLNPGSSSPIRSFTYQYLGSPSDSRLDCCTWQVGSTTGVTGTGQAIFYVNVDPNNPANLPLDSDVDGIKNLCDNCPTRPNGPLLGSCMSGTKIGKLCKSNQECPGGACSLAQDDADRAPPGDACVPEPGLGSMLGAGIGGLAWLTRRSKQSQSSQQSRISRLRSEHRARVIDRDRPRSAAS